MTIQLFRKGCEQVYTLLPPRESLGDMAGEAEPASDDAFATFRGLGVGAALAITMWTAFAWLSMRL